MAYFRATLNGGCGKPFIYQQLQNSNELLYGFVRDVEGRHPVRAYKKAEEKTVPAAAGGSESAHEETSGTESPPTPLQGGEAAAAAAHVPPHPPHHAAAVEDDVPVPAVAPTTDSDPTDQPQPSLKSSWTPRNALPIFRQQLKNLQKDKEMLARLAAVKEARRLAHQHFDTANPIHHSGSPPGECPGCPCGRHWR